jgi:uncharacterized membrane protein YgcG
MRLIFHLLLFLLLSFVGFGQAPPPMANTFVNDFAHVLSGPDIEDLNQQIKQLEERDSVQVALVLVKKLPEGMEIEDYAREIGRQWHAGIGRRGLVYVVSISQHKQRLEVAANLEGIIPDVTARTMTDSLKPLLRTGDYGGAMKNLVMWITVALENNTGSGEAMDSAGITAQSDGGGAGTPVQESPVQEIPAPQSGSHGGWGIFGFVLFFSIGFILFLIAIIVRMIRGKGGV